MRERVNAILARRSAELMRSPGSGVIVEKREPELARIPESDVRAALGKLRHAILDGSQISFNLLIKDVVKHAVKRHARRTLHQCEEKVQQTLKMLEDPEKFDSEPYLRKLALDAVDLAIEESEAPVPRGIPPSPYDPLLRDLAWVFKRGGGVVTPGSADVPSPFARWVFELLTCLPNCLGASLKGINNRIRNMKLHKAKLIEPLYSR